MSDKIAIIGYACRLPGQVSKPEDLWELCTRRRSGWSEIPKSRFSLDTYHHPNASKPGASNARGGYFLQDDITKFDASFFSLTQKEAVSLDPQQRLLLECTFEALENAGIPKEQYAGRNVGVYVGGNQSDYETNNVRDLETAPMHQATGCAIAMQSNRISYFFDFRGPSMTFDTACSGSLVALHHAVRSLRDGESSEAIVAGCRLNFLPDNFVTMSMSQLFNDAGKTFAFDERADSGFARGEGAGVVLLKPLEAALRDKDQIRAVIANTGVGQDGRTQGITNPNGEAQRDLIGQVYREAGLNPRHCGYAEMHGTGTKVGDPIEASAIHGALSYLRTPDDPLYIGSVKANVGHLEGASGVISIIKAAMMLDKELVLPTANFRKPNPAIPMNDWNMKVLTCTDVWPRGKKYVSVSNYGFGGTNAHAVLEMPPLEARQFLRPGKADAVDPSMKFFAISGNDKVSLQSRIKELGIYIEQRPEAFEKHLCPNLAYTLGSRRAHLAWRIAFSASSLSELSTKLAQAKITPSRAATSPSIAFVFTGQGAQWSEMGTDLMQSYPLFASVITKADKYLRKLGADFSLVEELEKDSSTSLVNTPRISQPACTAIQIGLVRLLKSWGIKPSQVVGHSSGEIAAAYAAGAFDADTAMALAYWRGDVTMKMKKLFPNLKGGMIAVGLGPDAVSAYLSKIKKGYLTIACVNSPSSVTVSGDVTAIAELHDTLDHEGIFNRQLKVDVAYHSQHLACISDVYLASIVDYLPNTSLKAEFYSSVHSRVASGVELGATYWVKNLLSTVQFSDALALMCSNDTRPDLLVEIGPHCALKGPIRDILKSCGPSATRILYTPTIVRGIDAAESVQGAAAVAFTKGSSINIPTINFPRTGAKFCSLLTDLPRYSWNHSNSFWHESRISNFHATRSGKRNDVLGVIADYSNDLEPTWRNIIRLDDTPWLRHHKMQGMPVFPLAGYLAMAVEAAQNRAVSQGRSFDCFELREVKVGSALVLSEGVDTETAITLRPFNDSSRGSSEVWDEFKIFSWDSKRSWAEHCYGLVRVTDSEKQKSNPVVSTKNPGLAALQNIGTATKYNAIKPIDEAEMYRVLDGVGASYGATFQGLRNCFSSSTQSRGEIFVTDTRGTMPKSHEPELVVHPSFLDIFVQLTWPILGAARTSFDTLYMPTMVETVKIDRTVVKNPGESLSVWCTGAPDFANPKPTSFKICGTKLTDPGRPIIQMDGFVMTPIRDSKAAQGVRIKEICYKQVSRPFKAGSNHLQTNSDVIADNFAIKSKSLSANASISRPRGSSIKGAKGCVNGHTKRRSIGHKRGLSGGISNSCPIDHAKDCSADYKNGYSSGYAVGYKKGYTNGQSRSHLNSLPNGHEIDYSNSRPNCLTNGLANGRSRSRAESRRRSNSRVHASKSTAALKTKDEATDRAKLNVPRDNSPALAETGSDIVVVRYGANDTLSTDLAGYIDVFSGSIPAESNLLEANCTAKRVVILQSRSKSLRKITSGEFSALKKILLEASQVIWVYEKDDPESAMSLGLARAVRSENMSKIVTLGVLSAEIGAATSPSIPIIRAVDALWLTDHDEPIKDMEFTSENGELLVQRIEEDDTLNSFVENETVGSKFVTQTFSQPGRRLKIDIGQHGALDTLRWIDDTPAPLGGDEVEIKVEATGVNFKDIVVSMGQVSQPYIGVECSGVITALGEHVTHMKVGQRVMAMVEGAYSTYARCLGTSAYPIGGSMSFEEAATVPVVFCTAYYGLFDLGRLEKGESVLIHAAAGGVGQAAIMLAQMAEAEIYVTVGSVGKKKLLMDKYSIPEDHIYYSRDSTFAAALRKATSGVGVDVVLNSLAGDILRETWECLAPFGRFVEIGKADITRNSRLDMLKFEYNCTFASVDLTKVAAYKPKLMNRLLRDVTALMAAGKISPISPVKVYSIAETEQAFRSLQSGKAMGKLVVTHGSQDQIMASKPKIGSKLFRKDGTYIIVGGAGGLGRSIARWMSQKGASHIVLTSRSSTISQGVQELIEELASVGTQVILISCDISDKASVGKLVRQTLKDLPPIRGAIHGAMVLKDVLYEQMTIDDFHSVASCKVDGAANMHEVLADSPLDFFIALSSVSGVVGNRGQAAYATANVFLDELMALRRSQGLPGISIDLAAVSDVGYLAKESESRRQEILKTINGSTINEAEVLALISAAVTGRMDETCQGQCITGLMTADAESFWINDARFSAIREKLDKASPGETGGSSNAAAAALSTVLRSAASAAEATGALTEALIAKISAVLVISADSIEASNTLKSLGLDSLVAIEIRNWITRETEVNVQVLELLSSGSITSLAELILKKMGV